MKATQEKRHEGHTGLFKVMLNKPVQENTQVGKVALLHVSYLCVTMTRILDKNNLTEDWFNSWSRSLKIGKPWQREHMGSSHQGGLGHSVWD